MCPISAGGAVICRNTGLTCPECSCRECTQKLLENFAPAGFVAGGPAPNSSATASFAVAPLPHHLMVPQRVRMTVAERLTRPAL